MEKGLSLLKGLQRIKTKPHIQAVETMGTKWLDALSESMEILGDLYAEKEYPVSFHPVCALIGKIGEK